MEMAGLAHEICETPFVKFMTHDHDHRVVDGSLAACPHNRQRSKRMKVTVTASRLHLAHCRKEPTVI